MKIGILGAGSWAIALSTLLENNGHRVKMWEFNEKDAQLLRQRREYPVKLPGIKIPESVEITSNAGDLFEDGEYKVMIYTSATLSRRIMRLPTGRGY